MSGAIPSRFNGNEENMKINLQNDGPSTFPVKFLNHEFIDIINEIYSIFHKYDDSCLDENSRQLYNVLLNVTETYVLDYYISLTFDFGILNSDHPEYIHGFIEQRFSSFDTMIHILKTISTNMKAVDKYNTSSEARAALILHNFSYCLDAVIILQDNWTDIGVLTIKGNEKDKERYKRLIPQWVIKHFNVSYTGF